MVWRSGPGPTMFAFANRVAFSAANRELLNADKAAARGSLAEFRQPDTAQRAAISDNNRPAQLADAA